MFLFNAMIKETTVAGDLRCAGVDPDGNKIKAEKAPFALVLTQETCNRHGWAVHTCENFTTHVMVVM